MVVLIDKILDEMGIGPLDQINQQQFKEIVAEIFQRISLLGRWSGGAVWGSEFAEDEDLMRRLGD